jgi:hypothetical protein
LRRLFELAAANLVVEVMEGSGTIGGGDGVVLVAEMVTKIMRRTRNSKGLDSKNQQLDQQCNQKFNKQ